MSASDWAQQLLAGQATVAEAATQTAWLPLAWALKDQCYAAWSTEPPRAALAADLLQDLAALTDPRQGTPADDRADDPPGAVRALAHWTDGIACITRGRMADAITALDAAAAAFTRLNEPAHAAQTQVPKVVALAMLGQHAAAVQCAEGTQQQLLALGQHLSAAKVSLNLAALQVRRGDYAPAARHAREAAVLFARAGDTEHSVMADISLADALTSLGDLDEAGRIYDRADMRAGHHGLPVLQALIDESRALLDLVRGRYHVALAGFERSRQRYASLAMPQHLAIAEKQLADAYLELRLLPEALALYEQAQHKFDALAMPDDSAWTLAQQGRALALQGRHGPAGRAFEQAGGLFAGQASAVGSAAIALARAELLLADRQPGQAAPLAAESAAGYARASIPEAVCRADAVQAEALLADGRTDAAIQLLDATLARAQALQLLPVQVRCHTALGQAAMARGDTRAATSAWQQAVSLFEDQRRLLPGDDVRTAFLADHLRPYQGLLRLALLAHQQQPTAAHAQDVLQGLERFRARALGERLVQPGSGDEPREVLALRERVNWLTRRIQRLHDEADTDSALTTELHRAERDLLERARRARLATADDSTAASMDVNTDASLARAGSVDTAALQQQLPADAALLEYGVVDNELMACVVKGGMVQVYRRLAAWDEVLQALRVLHFQLGSLQHGIAPVARHLGLLTERAQRCLQRLHSLVWAPLAPALAGVNRVLVVPHAQLGNLPFAALHDGDHALADLHQLALAPSANVALRGLTRPVPSPRTVLALGESSRLPHAGLEAQQVAGLFAQGQAHVGAEATLDRLRHHARQADVLHLACHAQFRADNPMFSALHLVDQPLTVDQAEALALPASLVVLSACDTGRADRGNGDEALGLVRGFLVGGASRVMAAQWPVDDAVTAAFMALFYPALLAGLSPAAALQSAQLSLRQQHAHPALWAAFALHGGW